MVLLPGTSTSRSNGGSEIKYHGDATKVRNEAVHYSILSVHKDNILVICM
jgi:hypothetical protein